ncbi:MAG: single-stranded DNA-binding protein [Clostridia bacterium]
MNNNFCNKVSISGVVCEELKFSHEVYGEKFYNTSLKVARLSNSFDILPITVSERLSELSLDVGQEITVKGQFRSYNKVELGRSRLMLTVFVREISQIDKSINSNEIELSGFICKPPIFRTTPFMREICDCLLAVNRAYNKSDYIPCIAWGRNARFIKYLATGQQISLLGRIQSREYQKKLSETEVETRIAYEVSIGKIALNTFDISSKDEKITFDYDLQ